MKSRIGTVIATALVLSSCSKSAGNGSDMDTEGSSGGPSGTAGASTSAAGASDGGHAGASGNSAGASGSVGSTSSAAGASGNSAGASGSAGSTSSAAGAGGSSSSAGSTGVGGGSVGASGGSGVSGAGGAASASCSGAVHSPTSTAQTLPSVALTVPSGFVLETIAKVGAARELAALPNGDLLVATSGQSIYLVPNADSSGAPGAPVVFTTINDNPVQGVAFVSSSCTVYASSQRGIYAMKYTDAQQSAPSGTAIASVRTGSISPNRPSGDTDNHTSTSVAFTGGKVYAGVGSSCNACVESDATRASIQQMDADGGNMATRAKRFRNAIALATNPATGTLWAGGAGQDDLTGSHPFEFFDAVGLHTGVPDYGWPDCEENHVAYTTGADCSATVAPLIELPPYSTIIGAVFYPAAAGSKAFPASYQGGLFLAAHGSWHMAGAAFAAAPLVVFVPMNGDAPQTAVDWTDPTKQWAQFVGGFQLADGKTRVARPTGLAVGALGSLFIADDQNGYVYRVRPM